MKKKKDFEFIKLIGEGGYGRVVLVRKKTTGTLLAMKIMGKIELLKEYKRDKRRVLTEREIFTRCNHPFICGLKYAFQTEVCT